MISAAYVEEAETSVLLGTSTETLMGMAPPEKDVDIVWLLVSAIKTTITSPTPDVPENGITLSDDEALILEHVVLTGGL